MAALRLPLLALTVLAVLGLKPLLRDWADRRAYGVHTSGHAFASEEKSNLNALYPTAMVHFGEKGF